MAKKTPNVLDDLLFHTAEASRRDTCPVDEAGCCVAVPARRGVALQDYAAAEGISVEDAVDRALRALLAGGSGSAAKPRKAAGKGGKKARKAKKPRRS